MKKGKKIAIFLVMILLFGLVSCHDRKPVVNPPQETGKVTNIVIEYNDERVDSGIITTNLSAQSIQIGARVTKSSDDLEVTVKYRSADNNIASIDNEGVITLRSAGEVVITAEAGAKSHAIVLVIEAQKSSSEHQITVIGGNSDKASASVGDYVSLNAEIPEHMEFVRWLYTVDGKAVNNIWTNGNVFKMVDSDITIEAVYQEKLYQLAVVNAEIAGNDDYLLEDNIKKYQLPYGAEFSLIANPDSAHEMFVGWDYQIKNNRRGTLGEKTLINLTMPGENITVWAVYSEKSDLGFPTTRDSFPYNGEGFKFITNGTPEGEQEDPDLLGMNGIRFSIDRNSTVRAIDDYSSENITGSNLRNGEKGSFTMKAVFKNHHPTASVTVEFYATYYGTRTTTGIVTIPANEVLTTHFLAPLGFNDPWMGFTLREAPNLSGSEKLYLDMVIEKAATYPEGDKQFEISGQAKWVTITNYEANNWPREKIINNNLGMSMIAVYAGNLDSNAYLVSKITNFPEYDGEETRTVYFRVINTNGNVGNFRFAFSDTNNPSNPDSVLAHHDFLLEANEVVVFAIEIPVTADLGSVYFGIVKNIYDSSDNLYGHNFVLQMAYNNIFVVEK